MKKILCISLSSTIQKTIFFNQLNINKVNRSLSYRFDASGKAVNSCRVLNQLQKGCSSIICALGTKNASLFLELAKKDNIKIHKLLTTGFTRECCTLLSKKDEQSSSYQVTELVVDEVINRTPSIKQIKKLEKKFFFILKNQIKKYDAVLLAGSRPFIWNSNIYPKIAELAIKNKKIFLADYCKDDLKETLKITIPSIIKINEEEFIQTFNIKSNITEDELKTEITTLSKKLNNIIIVTRGEKSTYSAQNGTFIETPIKKVKIINTIACGDSFSAGFLYEYINTNNLEKSLLKATECATKNALSIRPGSIFIDKTK